MVTTGGGATTTSSMFNGSVLAQRTTSGSTSTVVYLHGDHPSAALRACIGSVSATTTSAGGILNRQEYDPWGAIRSGDLPETVRDITGQRRDDTGLLYYTARYYDPGIGRFIGADTVVPGTASGSMAGIALKPLTVAFHEAPFLTKLNAENQAGPWYALSESEREQLGTPMGPVNPQSLNRYSYVLNSPMRWTDPGGHTVRLTHEAAYEHAMTIKGIANMLRGLAGASRAAFPALKEALLAYVAAQASAGVITTAFAAAIASVAAAAGAGLLTGGVMATLWLIGNRLNQYADAVLFYNGSDGVVITTDCNPLICATTIVDRASKDGVYLELPAYLFGAVLGERFGPDRLCNGVAPIKACHDLSGKVVHDD